VKRRFLSTAIAAAALLTAGCVTEHVRPRRGTPVRAAAPGASPSRVGAPPIALPSGPIASPASSVSSSSRVQVAVVPLGTLPYDGQALPLLSPDGRFLAVQSGAPPTWAAILAEPGAEPSLRTTLSAWSIGPRALERVEWPQPLPRGLVLGRGADDRGFLVEWPRDDGTRQIGRVSWATGGVDWLTEAPAVNAHAVLAGDDLVFTRRAVSGESTELVIRAPDGRESTRRAEAGEYAFPIVAGADALYCVVVTSAGLDFEALRIERRDGRVALGAPLARARLGPRPDLVDAYQAVASVQPTPATSTPAIFVPRLGRMAILDIDRGGFIPLAPRSVAAIPSDQASRPGWFCATPEGLVFTPADPARSASPAGSPVRILASPYVPRAVRRAPDEPESMILLGPVRGRSDHLEVLRLVFAESGTP